MHPMFVTLYLENDADDVLAEEEDRRRAANRVGGPSSRLGPTSGVVRSRPGPAGPPVRQSITAGSGRR